VEEAVMIQWAGSMSTVNELAFSEFWSSAVSILLSSDRAAQESSRQLHVGIGSAKKRLAAVKSTIYFTNVMRIGKLRCIFCSIFWISRAKTKLEIEILSDSTAKNVDALHLGAAMKKKYVGWNGRLLLKLS
jgi:hypothetical protein